MKDKEKIHKTINLTFREYTLLLLTLDNGDGNGSFLDGWITEEEDKKIYVNLMSRIGLTNYRDIPVEYQTN